MRALRLDQRLSQEELAFRCGVHRTFLSGVERGELNLGWQNVVKVCRGLGVPLSRFLQRLTRSTGVV